MTFVLLVVGYGTGFWSCRRRRAAVAEPGCGHRRSPRTSARPPLYLTAMRFLSRFVDSNDREIRRLQPLVDETNALEAEIEALSDDEIRAQFAEIRAEIRRGRRARTSRPRTSSTTPTSSAAAS